jgi:hypothetical protein
MKAQMMFEDFIIGFLMFFGLASTVFLFINSNAGSGIDFFNTSIYQEDKFELDFVYLTIYEDNMINPSKFSLNQEELELNFSLKRTNLPSGDYPIQYSNMPVKVIIQWNNFTSGEGLKIESNEKIISYTYKVQEQTSQGIILKGDEVNYSYKFNESFKNIKRENCSSNITFKVEIISEYFSETALSNNEYSVLVPFCFYEPVDLRIDNACVPLSPDSQSCQDAPLPLDSSANYPLIALEAQDFDFNAYNPYILKFFISNSYGAPIDYSLSITAFKGNENYTLAIDPLIVTENSNKYEAFQNFLSAPAGSFSQIIADLRMANISIANETGWLNYYNLYSQNMLNRDCAGQYFKITVAPINVYDTNLSNNEIEKYVGWCI